MRSQPVNEIIKKWAQALHDDEKINTYCQEHYGKLPIIQIGWDEQNSPTEDDCPYICLHEAEKNGAETRKEYTYTVSVLWAVHNDDYTEDDRMRVYAGAVECDELGELILDAMNNTNTSWPLTAIDYTAANENYYPGFPGNAVVTLSLTHVLGAKVTY